MAYCESHHITNDAWQHDAHHLQRNPQYLGRLQKMPPPIRCWYSIGPAGD
nr:MAG TPA: hypothetical protein [Bacteriophage sp.]